MASFLIRRAKMADLEKIRRLNQLLFYNDFKYEKTLNCKWPSSADASKYFKNRITSNKSCAFVACDKNKIVGYLIGAVAEAQFYRTIKKYGELENMFVIEEYRSHGIGSLLVKEFVKWCKKKGIKKTRVVFSSGNLKVIKFYKKVGFKDSDTALEADI